MADDNLPARTDLDRALLFRRGFGDGARASAMKHDSEPDYVEGYIEGRTEAQAAVDRFRIRHGLQPGTILRVRSAAGSS